MDIVLDNSVKNFIKNYDIQNEKYITGDIEKLKKDTAYYSQLLYTRFILRLEDYQKNTNTILQLLPQNRIDYNKRWDNDRFIIFKLQARLNTLEEKKNYKNIYEYQNELKAVIKDIYSYNDKWRNEDEFNNSILGIKNIINILLGKENDDFFTKETEFRVAKVLDRKITTLFSKTDPSNILYDIIQNYHSTYDELIFIQKELIKLFNLNNENGLPIFNAIRYNINIIKTDINSIPNPIIDILNSEISIIEKSKQKHIKNKKYINDLLNDLLPLQQKIGSDEIENNEIKMKTKKMSIVIIILLIIFMLCLLFITVYSIFNFKNDLLHIGLTLTSFIALIETLILFG